MSDRESAFWRFSLSLYAQPGVADACMVLQDKHGADINVLFFLLYLASRRRCVDRADVSRIDGHTKLWREQVVQPLRMVRRALKNGVAPVPTPASTALRNEIKRDELHAERLQQETLEQDFPLDNTGTGAAPEAPVTTVAAGNLSAYAACSWAYSQTEIDTLLRAMNAH